MYNDKSYNDKSAGECSGAFVFGGDNEKKWGVRRRVFKIP